MAPKRKQPTRDTGPAPEGDQGLRARRAAADSRMFESSVQRGEADGAVKERSSPEPAQDPPTIGKTGRRGAKAERPSPESERRRAEAPPVEVSRGSKPPAETPKSHGRAGAPKAAGS